MRRAKRPTLAVRFPRGVKVRVHSDFGDHRYADRLGHVVGVHEQPESPVYPFGRVEVLMVIDELWRKLWHPDKPPKTVWFKPNMIERLHDDSA